MGIFGWGKSWRGMDDEEEMTEEDWKQRGTEQAIAMFHGRHPFHSSPDEDGIPTGGCYNADYPQSWHDECNRRLEEDEHYEAEVESQLRDLNHYRQDS